MTALLALALAAPPAPGYAATVRPFFAAYCDRCHGGDRPKGDFALDPARLPPDLRDPAAAGRWAEVMRVLNAGQMPPKAAEQPTLAEAAAVADWVSAEAVRAKGTGRVVLRRLNRHEYRNTLRELLGVDVDVSGFPHDPPAGGFDTNGGALTVSPLHLETYLAAAEAALDRALVTGERPKAVKWRFTPKVGPTDRTRVRLDKTNNPLVNGGNNRQDGAWVAVHHGAWDKGVGARDFRVPTAGDYAVRVHAAGRVPTRDEVLASVEPILKQRQQEQDKKNPKGAKSAAGQFQRDLDHFRTSRHYRYGPPRAKLVLQLGPQPRTVAEFDADGTPDAPKTHEFVARFTTESAGVHLEYAYSVPSELENFWLQRKPEFARPELLIDWFEVEGPLFDAWPPRSHTGVLFPDPLHQTDERKYAEAVLTKFLRAAYRRPVAAEEIAGKLKLFDAARAGGADFVTSIKRPLAAALVSPHFLYLTEPAPDPRPLTAHELAARLSYLLHSGPPDAALTAAADRGGLLRPDERVKQVDRLLADPRSGEFVRHFAGQWLGLREVGNNPPAADLFPQYDRHLETSMAAEGEAFFAEVLANDLDARTLVRSDFVVVNERLARFYGLDGVKGDQFRKVPVSPETHRGGLPTLAAVLATTSNGTRTSPVKRGTWVLKTLLGQDPGLPVADAGEIAPKVPGIDKATVRQRLEAHRALPRCARCHDRIDPFGLALENFDAAGGWRDREGFGYKGRVQANDPKVNAVAELPDGTTLDGVAGLQAEILKHEDQFLGCLATKVLTYALGRELGLADRPTVVAAVAHMKANGRTLRSLLRFVATSEPFGAK